MSAPETTTNIPATGTSRVKRGMAEMLKGGVIMDVVTPEQAKNNIEKRIPLHREGRPEDVAHAIAMLVCNDFITGENFAIDGGMSMRIV